MGGGASGEPTRSNSVKHPAKANEKPPAVQAPRHNQA